MFPLKCCSFLLAAAIAMDFICCFVEELWDYLLALGLSCFCFMLTDENTRVHWIAIVIFRTPLCLYTTFRGDFDAAKRLIRVCRLKLGILVDVGREKKNKKV